MENLEVPAVFMRGGAASGLFFHLNDLPEAGVQRDRILICAMGSPDPYGMQLNGLGSGTTSTSKAVLISRSANEIFDIEYLFAQIAVDRAEVDWTRSCGNLAAAAALFAVEESLVERSGHRFAEFKMHQVNRDEAINAKVERASGKVWLTFENRDNTRSPILGPSTAFTVSVAGLGEISVSVIDATNSFIFVSALDLHAAIGSEFDFEVLKRNVELLRVAVTKELGQSENQTGPRVLLVESPKDFHDISGREVHSEDVDLIVRALSIRGMHHSLPMTAVMATSVAAMISGTIVHGHARRVNKGSPLRVGHQSGVDEASPTLQGGITSEDAQISFDSITIALDARRIMTGKVNIPATF